MAARGPRGRECEPADCTMVELPSRRHPFQSRERINFPDFSPIFSRHVTPENAQGFHWSIDHIARLKPADIDTDPVSLVVTNGESPENDGERQHVTDSFFSQRSILPSPWPTGPRQRSSLRQGLTHSLLPRFSLTPATHPKKVTFSPLPPSTAYISDDSSESDCKENALVNVSTQTCLTIPLSHNLAELGPGCVCCEPDGGIRDLANSSLRRKLFGQPSRESEEEEEEEGEGGKEEQRCTVENVTPMRCRSRDCSHLSSTPLKSRSSPLSPPVYSAHSSGVRTHNPTSSSLVLTPGVGLPQLSPIEGDQGNSGRSKGNCDTCKRLFQLTPNLQSSGDPHLTPSPSCPSFSPILSHPAMGGGACEGMKGVSVTTVTPCRVSTSPPTKATSTPYHNGVGTREQELAGEVGALLVTHSGPERAPEREEGAERGGGGVDDGEDLLPQPLSLADLQTFEEELTSVTGVTSCTSYFTQLATDDSRSASERQPLHSTVAVQNSNPLGSAPDPLWGAARFRLPSIREISQINDPSIAGAATDSGVAGSLDNFNQPPGGSLTISRGAGNLAALSSPVEQGRKNVATSLKSRLGSEVDSGLVPSPDHAHNGHTPGEDDVVKGVSRDLPLSQPSATPRGTAAERPHITPSRYSTHRNKLGVPLLVSQRLLSAHRPLIGRSFLPSQLRLLPPRQTPPSTSSREATPSRLTGYSNWFGESLGRTGGGHAPLFPEEVIRRKATLKAQLQFCSPVRSRSPLSNCRRPLMEMLNLPSPVTGLPFATLPPSPSCLPPSPAKYRTRPLLTQLTQD